MYPLPPIFIFKILQIILTSLKSMLSEDHQTEKYQYVRHMNPEVRVVGQFEGADF